MSPAEAEPIPEGGLLLHIGPQKTGSTSLQQSMHQGRDDLAAHGVLYPGPRFRPAEAGWAVMGINSAVGRPAPRIELWDELVAQVAATRLPRVCVSDEDFARADHAAIDRILNTLGGARVHVVYVARRLDQLLPSHWQERVKSRMTSSYPDFVEQMIQPEPTGWEWHMTWDSQMAGAVVDRWAEHVDRSRITVVVADKTDRDRLPRSFEAMLALPLGTLRPPQHKTNRSLGYVEAEAVRRINQVWRECGWTPEAYWRIVQAGIAGKLTNAPRTGRDVPIPPLSDAAFARVADLADEQATAIAEAGVRVIGDPESLRIRDLPRPTGEPVTVDEVSMDLLASIVQGAVDGAFDLQRRTVRKERKAAKRRALDKLGGRELARMLRGRLAARVRRPR